LENLEQFFSQLTYDGYAVIGIVIVLILFLLHSYSQMQSKKKLRKLLNDNFKVFQKKFDVIEDGIVILSVHNRVIYANKSAIDILGLKKDFLDKVLRNVPQLKVKSEWVPLDEFIEEHYEKSKKEPLLFSHSALKNHNNDSIPIHLTLDTIGMNENATEYYKVIFIQDLSKMQVGKEEAYKHKLTGLPNQLQAMQNLPKLFSRIHLENKKIALALLNIDNFTQLRSILGYEQTNAVLIKFAKYLQNLASNLNISVYHTFDNHFLLTVSRLDSLDEIKQFIGEIQEKIGTFYKIEETHLHLTVSAGVAVYPDSGPTRKLMDNAYSALVQAEKEGDGRMEIYMPDKFSKEYDELTLHNDMQSALEKGEFEVYYQPIVKADTHEIVSAEALIRWIHPTYGFIPPDVFIGLMEQTGFIIKLGQYILEQVLKQQKRWELFNFKKIEVSINVSVIELNTGVFDQHVEKELQRHKVDPGSIKFEITESSAMGGEEKAVKYFKKLKKLGVGISLDDFGTGYTSFDYLKKFPADIVKIDKTLVDNILESKEDQRIVNAMIELGHNLGMKVVVEGVENKKMATLLASYGCDYLQGYHFSKPLPVFELQEWIREV
jgi:diguanylate cyclase (GGDEF)-like protein